MAKKATVRPRDLLVEIGTEELPPVSLPHLAQAFAEGVQAELARLNLSHGGCTWYATPRRLAILVKMLAPAQPDREIVRRGPALSAAFDKSGSPTPAAEGFARSCGVKLASLGRDETDKGAWLVYRGREKGKATVKLVEEVISIALQRLPVARRMRWGAGEVEFVRPVHWLVVMFGGDVVPCSVLGVKAQKRTRGHRFHHPRPITLSGPGSYVSTLAKRGRVLVDFQERRKVIEEQVLRAGKAAGGRALIESALLDEVTALVEWPVAITGSFERRFLDLPREVLIAAMQEHQRYFPVARKSTDSLLPHFIVVSNIESREPAQVRQGNERVIRPRLADATFFWERDRRRPLSAYSQELSGVVFEQQLGSLLDKSRRVARLATFMAKQLGIPEKDARRAAELAKCDLLTEVVGEFPQLQGVMGRYHAQQDGEPESVATALEEQYMPRFAGDALPSGAVGRILSMADRLDSIVGIFAIDQAPTGEKDPFGLRRSALGCLRILIECELDLDLHECLKHAAAGFSEDVPAAGRVESVFDFMMERLRRYYLDAGTRSDVFDAVLARRPTRPRDFNLRVHAVTEFTRLPEAQSLAAANKRIRNILRQAGGAPRERFLPDLLKEPAERDLAGAMVTAAGTVQPLFGRSDYKAALARLAKLRPAVDAFFDQVMVMCEDEALRRNRLALLNELSELFLMSADISVLQTT